MPYCVNTGSYTFNLSFFKFSSEIVTVLFSTWFSFISYALMKLSIMVPNIPWPYGWAHEPGAAGTIIHPLEYSPHHDIQSVAVLQIDSRLLTSIFPRKSRDGPGTPMATVSSNLWRDCQKHKASEEERDRNTAVTFLPEFCTKLDLKRAPCLPVGATATEGI